MRKTLKGFLLVSLLAALALSSCVQKPQAEETTEWEGKDKIEVSGDEMDKTTSALADRYDNYATLSALAFKETATNAESDFKVTLENGEATVTEYIGKSGIVVIPETVGESRVTKIAASAFSGKNVSALYIPDSVVSMEKGALGGMDALATLRLPFVGDGGENTHFGYIFGADSYENHALKVPSTLDMVILGDGVTEISENAFAGCKMISAMVLPVGLEKIGAFAFYECKDLVYISRNTAVKEIGNYAFGYCSVLFKAELLMAESIGLGAFYECSALRSLSLPFVGGSAQDNRFLGYIFGAEIADYNGEFVPASLKSVSISARACKDIPDRAFAGCSSISEFIFDVGIESIGTRAFYACRSLTGITLPDGVKTICDDAFFGCDNLVSVELGDGVESIGMQAFYGCRSLKTVELPEKVTEIKPSTFALCSALERISLGGVKKIGKDAFWGCSKLSAADVSGIEVADGNECLVGEK